ncbi:MAG: hypothetical protein KDD62_13160, partial [Bdellovibrionales bacterium]|nr:hypothetical protein [Bdellovibrionales bacterium]
MTSTRRISIVGATGLLGAEFIQLLSESTLAGFELDLFASEDSVGEYYEVAGQEVEVHAFAPDKLQGSELVLLACPAEVSAEILKTKLAEQVPIIDLS